MSMLRNPDSLLNRAYREVGNVLSISCRGTSTLACVAAG